MEQLHSLLRRQLRKHLTYKSFPEELNVFINAVNDAYHQSDTDRGMLEHSLELSSRELLQANAELKAILHAFPDLFLILDFNGKILDSRGGYGDDFYLPADKLIGKNIQETSINIISENFHDAAKSIRDTKSMTCLEYSLTNGRDKLFYEARLLPLSGTEILVIVRNITERIKVEGEREKLIKNLQDALSEVKTLSGLLPICASCKKIRDDKGYWNQIESYLHEHSDAEFSHGLCPECMDKMYGEQDWYQKKDKE